MRLIIATFVFKYSTFYYINAAPQWQTFNSGNWLSVENSVRSLAEDQGRELVVYTGTNGVMRLKDEEGDEVDIFLYPEEGRLPVPK